MTGEYGPCGLRWWWFLLASALLALNYRPGVLVSSVELHLPSIFGSQSGVTKPFRRAEPSDDACPLPGSVNVAVVAAGFEPWPGNVAVKRSGKAAGAGADGVLKELIILLKSILLSTQETITLYAITDPTGAARLRKDVAEQLSGTTSSRCAVVPVPFDPLNVTAWLSGIGMDVNSCPGCPWTMVKALVYRLLPDCVEWVIAVDTDVMFIGDIKDMWAERLRFNSKQMVGGVPEANKYNPRFGAPDLPNVMNAGILLTNVRRMRGADYMGKTLLEADCKQRKETGCTSVLPKNVPFADQSMMALVLSSFPQYLFRLPKHWNVQGCGRFGTTATAEKKAAGGSGKLGAVHFTCRKRDLDSWASVKRTQKRIAATPLSSI
mmetsp:Transcript_91/g.292  ORF Transcript_91/g.292 Transcript_91/m.292 type:complete len:378 (-) Transcript_91:480-1613(-)